LDIAGRTGKVFGLGGEKESMGNDALASLAHHESGHAVAGCVQGFKVDYVTITPDPDGGNAGETRFFYDPIWVYEHRAIEFFRQHLTRLFSAFFAACYSEAISTTISAEEFERHVQTQLKVAGLGSVGRGDLSQVEEILSYLRDEKQDPEQCKQEAVQDAINLVRNHWSAIDALAKNLLIEKTMTGEQVHSVLQLFGLSAK
jgi:ATP-dependent Zn protease